jgi:oxazoline/thiazoline synthase
MKNFSPFLRIKSHWTVNRAKNDTFILFSEQGTQFLSGPLMARVLPLLDGTRTLTSLTSEIAGEFSEDEVKSAIESLRDDGFLSSTSTMARAEAAFWELEGTELESIHARHLTAIATVASIEQHSPTQISDGLRALGVAVTNDAPFQVILARDYLAPELGTLNRDALRSNRPWMLVRPWGRQHWLGPIFVPGQTACWQCMADALILNGWSDAAFVANLPTTAAVTQTMAATEGAKWLFTGRNSSVEGQILAIDTVALSMSTHALRRRPQCPACGPSEVVELTLDGIVSPHTGVVSSITQSEPSSGFHTAQATGSQILSYAANDSYVYCKRDRFSGKGHSKEIARQRCLGEAVERYSVRYHGDESTMTASLDELGGTAVHPHDLLLYSSRQYSDGSDVPKPFDPAKAVTWLAGRDLSSDKVVFVSAGFCLFGYVEPFCVTDSNGCAAGSSFEAACLSGLLELVERDAVSIWWYNRARRPAFPIDPETTPSLRYLLEAIRATERRIVLVDVTTDTQIPACVAVTTSNDGSRVLLGSGAAGTYERAAERALLEVVDLTISIGGIGRDSGDQVAKNIFEWFDAHSLSSDCYLKPASDAPRNPCTELPNDTALALQEAVRRLNGVGIAPIAVDLTRPELGIPAVRMLAPGLRHWHPRFAAGRLYDVPVRLGWRSQPVSEDELNPIPWFL